MAYRSRRRTSTRRTSSYRTARRSYGRRRVTRRRTTRRSPARTTRLVIQVVGAGSPGVPTSMTNLGQKSARTLRARF